MSEKNGLEFNPAKRTGTESPSEIINEAISSISSLKINCDFSFNLRHYDIKYALNLEDYWDEIKNSQNHIKILRISLIKLFINNLVDTSDDLLDGLEEPNYLNLTNKIFEIIEKYRSELAIELDSKPDISFSKDILPNLKSRGINIEQMVRPVNMPVIIGRELYQQINLLIEILKKIGLDPFKYTNISDEQKIEIKEGLLYRPMVYINSITTLKIHDKTMEPFEYILGVPQLYEWENFINFVKDESVGDELKKSIVYCFTNNFGNLEVDESFESKLFEELKPGNSGVNLQTPFHYELFELAVWLRPDRAYKIILNTLKNKRIKEYLIAGETISSKQLMVKILTLFVTNGFISSKLNLFLDEIKLDKGNSSKSKLSYSDVIRKLIEDLPNKINDSIELISQLSDTDFDILDKKSLKIVIDAIKNGILTKKFFLFYQNLNQVSKDKFLKILDSFKQGILTSMAQQETRTLSKVKQDFVNEMEKIAPENFEVGDWTKDFENILCVAFGVTPNMSFI